MTELELAVGSRRIGKRITLSRPMIESLGATAVDRTELLAPVLRVVDTDDFLTGDLCVTVDDVVTWVVVETVSTEAVSAAEAADEAATVSAADCAGRLQPAANKKAEKAPASDSFVIDQFLESWEARSVCVPTLFPTRPE